MAYVAVNSVNRFDTIVLVKTNQEGIDLVAKGQVAAYFADGAALTFLLRKEKGQRAS